MNESHTIHYKALLHAIKYPIDTKYYCYQMKPDGNINGPWELRGYSDADYTGDNDTRKTTTGYIFIINRAIINWNSQSQKTVTLSVTEDEYSAITEVCCEILFVHEILLFMGVVAEYLITAHVDNVGVIFLSNNT